MKKGFYRHRTQRQNFSFSHIQIFVLMSPSNEFEKIIPQKYISFVRIWIKIIVQMMITALFVFYLFAFAHNLQLKVDDYDARCRQNEQISFGVFSTMKIDKIQRVKLLTRFANLTE